MFFYTIFLVISMKTKYEVLNKEKKKEIKNAFYTSEFGKKFKKHFLTSIISLWVCYFYGFYIILDNYFHDKTILLYIFGASVSITSIVLLFYARNIFLKKVNLFIIRNKKQN